MRIIISPAKKMNADTDTLLVFLKFLCIEITTARIERLVADLESYVVGLLQVRLNA